MAHFFKKNYSVSVTQGAPGIFEKAAHHLSNGVQKFVSP